jgi:hypothetical protein
LKLTYEFSFLHFFNKGLVNYNHPNTVLPDDAGREQVSSKPNLNIAIDGSIHSYDVHNFIIQTFECLTESIKNRPTGDDVSKSLASGLDKCMLQVALITIGAL